jgi:hypothetical protein
MFVVGVDFGEAVFDGGGEVNSVGGAEIGGGRGGGEYALDAVEDGIGEGEKADVPTCDVRVELGENDSESVGGQSQITDIYTVV